MIFDCLSFRNGWFCIILLVKKSKKKNSLDHCNRHCRQLKLIKVEYYEFSMRKVWIRSIKLEKQTDK